MDQAVYVISKKIGEILGILEIHKEGELLNTNLRDLRLSTRKNQTLVVTLENPDHLAIYNYQVKLQTTIL